MLPDYSAALDQYSQARGFGTIGHNLSNSIMDLYGMHFVSAILNASDWFGLIWAWEFVREFLKYARGVSTWASFHYPDDCAKPKYRNKELIMEKPR